MQAPRTALRPPRAGGERVQRFRTESEPFGELEDQLASDVASAGRTIVAAVRAYGRGSQEEALARAAYLSALERLSHLRPGVPLWRLERMALPPGLRDPEVEVLGLPRTRLPFSPGDLWPAEPTERELAIRLSGEGHSVYARQLARMLDRMVLSGQPPSDFGEPYRPYVAKLASGAGRSSYSYYGDLAAAASALARLLVPAIARRNANLLKMSSHKDICTKTGDALAEPDPDKRPSFIRDKKVPLRVADIRVGATMLSRLGMESGSDEVIDSISQSWGLPMRECSFPPARPGREELLSSLSFHISAGGTTYSHPDLPGMEFSEEQIGSALRLLSAAGLMEGPEEAEAEPLALGMLTQLRGTSGEPEAKAAIRCALIVVMTMDRAGGIRSADQSVEDACLQAAEDVKAATSMVSQFRAERAAPNPEPHMVAVRVRRMLQLSREMPGSSPFDLAISVIDEMRRDRVSLHTLAPASSLNEPPVQIPSSGKVPIIAPSAGSRSDAPEIVPLPSPETAYRPEDEEGATAEPDGGTATPPASEGREEETVVPSGPQSGPANDSAPAAETDEAATAGPESAEEKGPEREAPSAPMDSVHPAVRKATLLGFGAVPAAPVQPVPVAQLEEPAESPAAAEFDSERPTVVTPIIPQAILELIPVQKVALDEELERELPPNTDSQTAAVRHLSRYMAGCFTNGFNESLLPPFLRETYSHLLKTDAGGKVLMSLRAVISTDAPDMSSAEPHETIFDHEGYHVSPRLIVDSVTALLKRTDPSSLGREEVQSEQAAAPGPTETGEEAGRHDEAPQVEITVEAEETPLEQAIAGAAEQAKPALVLPLDNCMLDDRLEDTLPPKTDLRSRYVRHVSRILGYYLIYGVDDREVHEQYLEAVQRLRGQPTVHNVPILYITGSPGKDGEYKDISGYEFSPADVVREAEGIVGRCDLKTVVTREEYLLSLTRKAAEAASDGETAGAAQGAEAEPAAAQEEAPAAVPAKAERAQLVLPISNSIMDDALEAVLPPKTDQRAALIRHASRIIGYYLVNGYGDEHIHEQYAPIVARLRGAKVIRNIPMKYITGNDTGESTPVEGFTYDPQEAVRLAAELVDSSDTSQIAAPQVPARDGPRAAAAPDVRELKAKLGSLSAEERSLLSAVMGREADEVVVWEFMNMNAGRRDLLLQQFVDSRWNEGDWRKDLEGARKASDSIYGTLGIERAGPEQRLSAVLDPTSLSQMQRHFVSSLFNISPAEVAPVHIEGFAAWVSGDQGRISAFWDKFFVVDPQRLSAVAGKMKSGAGGFDAGELELVAWMHGKRPDALTQAELHDTQRASSWASAMQGLKEFWTRTPLEERRRFWRTRDLLAAADLAERLRFSPGSGLGRAEAGVLSIMLGRPVTDRAQLTQPEVSRLNRALVQHSTTIPEVLRRIAVPSEQPGAEELAVLSSLCGRPISDRSQLTQFDLQRAQMSYEARYKAMGEERFYSSEIVNLASMGSAVHPSSLLIAARREADFTTLIEFAGLKAERVQGRIDLSSGISKPKRKNGGYLHTNDDSFSSAVVEMPDGRSLVADLVCDGMGGMDKGAQGPIPNGQIASGISKDIFEISAAAGWIRSPEDARKVVAMADLAVTMEQIYRKRSSLDQEAASKGEAVDAAAAFKQRNLMGTTMVIGLQDGRRFWGIHCGDSPWKVLRGQDAQAEADEHSLEYHIRLTTGVGIDEFYRTQLGPVVASDVRQQWLSSKEHAEGLARSDPAYVASFERQVSETLEKAVSDKVYRANSIVAAGLAQNMQYLHINNRESGYAPIFLEDGDIIALASDGITVPICNHEFRMILDSADGDFAKARGLILGLAEARINRGPHPTLCACGSREGKSDDDKTIIMRPASGWFRDGEMKKRLTEDPRSFASSPERLAIVAHCLQADSASVKESMLSFMEAAESAPAPSRSDVFTVSIATIFDIASQRADRDELLDYLSPRLGSWSGLLLRKLMKSPDFSPRKEAMLSVVSRSVPPEELAQLTGAGNPQIAAAASAILRHSTSPTITEEPDMPEPIFRSQKSESGRPLLPSETRYLDSFLIDINESVIVQETAAKLRVLPRDLEIMVFNVYSGFDPAVAVDPHSTAEGQNLISEVILNLSAQDAKKILVSSYLIYRLRETEPSAAEVQRFTEVLWKSVKGMDQSTPYAFRFYNEALRLVKQQDPEDPRCFQG